MAIVTTGSLVVASFPGLKCGILPSGTYSGVGPVFGYVVGNPDGKLTCTTGSDVVYDIGAGKFYIGDITNGKNGSKWSELTTD
jgi:hypothetical protein